MSHRVTSVSWFAWDCLGFKIGSPHLGNPLSCGHVRADNSTITEACTYSEVLVTKACGEAWPGPWHSPGPCHSSGSATNCLSDQGPAPSFLNLFLYFFKMRRLDMILQWFLRLLLAVTLHFRSECHCLPEQRTSGPGKEGPSAWNIKWLSEPLDQGVLEHWRKKSCFVGHSLLVWVPLCSGQTIQLSAVALSARSCRTLFVLRYLTYLYWISLRPE